MISILLKPIQKHVASFCFAEGFSLGYIIYLEQLSWRFPEMICKTVWANLDIKSIFRLTQPISYILLDKLCINLDKQICLTLQIERNMNFCIIFQVFRIKLNSIFFQSKNNIFSMIMLCLFRNETEITYFQSVYMKTQTQSLILMTAS